MNNQPISHLRKIDKARQPLWDHLKNVSILSGEFTNKIGVKETGEILGLLHDLGKASKEFQNYLQFATGLLDPDVDEAVNPKAKRGDVDHSSAGAQAIFRKLNNQGGEGRIAAQVLALCLASHHSGLIDCLTPDGKNNFKRRIEKSEEKTHTDEVLSYLNDKEIEELNKHFSSDTIAQKLVEKMKSLREDIDHQDTILFKYGLLIRFLFSCLIDADRLDAADFENPSNIHLRSEGQYFSWETLIRRFDSKIKEFEDKPNKNKVDELRNQVSQACFYSASKSCGIYQLTVPTGGGKTLASLRFALNHAAHHHMDRIFYIIPYTSIIDQNAEEARKILEDKDEVGRFLDNVILEHHSNLTPEYETYRQNLLSENWDAPIVFTTQVQFLEALFGSGTRGARRMHQLANSVIIFDEVQTIPINCIHMLNSAIRFLVKCCGASVLLCTATQPPLDKIDLTHRALIIQADQRIIHDEKELFERLTRVEVFDRRKVGGFSDEEIVDLVIQELRQTGSVLVIVNTKKSARTLYQSITSKHITDVYHLSTNMCPAHRLEKLELIKKKLAQAEPVICVSTQLIEAGVDIDFGSVIRYLAGLDSITQAAGRCNRNGVRLIGNVWIVNPANENIDRLKDIKIGIEKTVRVLDDFQNKPDDFGNNRIGLDAMAAYYKYYFYARKNDMRYPVGKDSLIGREDDLYNLLSVNNISVEEYKRINHSAPDIVFLQSFQSASTVFQVIDSPTIGVVVPYKTEGKEIINDLCSAIDLNKQYNLLKRAQRYSVNLFQNEFMKMVEQGAIREVLQNSGVCYLDDQYYSDQFGWSDEAVNDMEILIF